MEISNEARGQRDTVGGGLGFKVQDLTAGRSYIVITLANFRALGSQSWSGSTTLVIPRAELQTISTIIEQHGVGTVVRKNLRAPMEITVRNRLDYELRTKATNLEM